MFLSSVKSNENLVSTSTASQYVPLLCDWNSHKCVYIRWLEWTIPVERSSHWSQVGLKSGKPKFKWVEAVSRTGHDRAFVAWAVGIQEKLKRHRGEKVSIIVWISSNFRLSRLLRGFSSVSWTAFCTVINNVWLGNYTNTTASYGVYWNVQKWSFNNYEAATALRTVLLPTLSLQISNFAQNSTSNTRLHSTLHSLNSWYRNITD